MALGLVWKPKSLGSQEALGQLKRNLKVPGKGREGIGHAGILDPFAEGYLLVGTELGTKLLNPLVGLDKTYEAEICLGATTETLDNTEELIRPEGLVKKHVQQWLSRPDAMIEHELRDYLSDFQEREIQQTPPKYSAVRVKGERAYNLARFEGKNPELKAKKVTIHSAEHLAFEKLDENTALWRVRVHVSSGTYVRVLAQDWGNELCQYPGHLTRLVRTQIGPFGGESSELKSKSLDEEGLGWQQFQTLGLTELKKVFDIHYLTESEARRVRDHGQWKPRPHSKPVLLVGPGSMGIVAFTNSGHGKLGRVFREDPLKCLSDEPHGA